jgi:hypothetical protein
MLYEGDYMIITKIAGIGYSLERTAGELLGHHLGEFRHRALGQTFPSDPRGPNLCAGRNRSRNRTKRLEPRLIQLHRRRVLTFYDLVRTAAQLPPAPAAGSEPTKDTESGIRALAALDTHNYPFVIEDTRKERGDYDDFFRISKPPHDGTLEQVPSPSTLRRGHPAQPLLLSSPARAHLPSSHTWMLHACRICWIMAMRFFRGTCLRSITPRT